MPADWNPDPVMSALGEERILWRHEVKAGWLRQTTVRTQLITNLRVSEGVPVLLKDIDAVVVANKRQETEHRGTANRYYQDDRYRRAPDHYRLKSTSRTVGDVIFMRDGRAAITFRGVEDPDGAAEIARAARSNILDIMNSIEGKSSQNSPCPQCSRPNPPGSNFCNSCGGKLAGGPATCPNCRRENPAQASFCGGCGISL